MGFTDKFMTILEGSCESLSQAPIIRGATITQLSDDDMQYKILHKIWASYAFMSVNAIRFVFRCVTVLKYAITLGVLESTHYSN
jgi:hypothetical protein